MWPMDLAVNIQTSWVMLSLKRSIREKAGGWLRIMTWTLGNISSILIFTI